MENSSHLEKHIGYWLRFVSNQVSLSFTHQLSSYDISVAEWVVLNLLQEHAQSPVIIAKKMGMTKGAISKVMDKLGDKNLIDRMESATDRRYLTFNLSEKGKKLLPKLRKIADDNDHRFFGHLPKDERDKIIDFFRGIVSKHQWKDIPIH